MKIYANKKYPKIWQKNNYRYNRCIDLYFKIIVMSLSIQEQLTHFESLSHEDKYKEVKNMTRIIWDAWWVFNWLDDTIWEFWKYATDEDLRTIYENILLLLKDYQDKKENN